MAATRSLVTALAVEPGNGSENGTSMIEPTLTCVSRAQPSGAHTPAPRGPSTTVTCCLNPGRTTSVTFAGVCGVGSGMLVTSGLDTTSWTSGAPNPGCAFS